MCGPCAILAPPDDHQQDINDQGVLGTRLGGTKVKKMTMGHHQQDINDPRVLGTRRGGTKAMKKTIARVQESGGPMTSDQLRKMIKEIWGEDGRDKKNED